MIPNQLQPDPTAGPPPKAPYPDYEDMRHTWQIKHGKDLSFADYLKEIEKLYQDGLRESLARIMSQPKT